MWVVLTFLIISLGVLVSILSMCSQKCYSLAHYYLLGPYIVLEDRITARRCKNLQLGEHTGEVAVITGGHRGIGAKVTKDLLSTGMHVVMGCRNTEDGVKFMNSLREQGMTSGTATFIPLDLSSFQSVREFADIVLQKTDRINYLINNAGIINFLGSYEETEDNFETQWQVNYLSHFLLCHLLLPTLQNTRGCAKIVNASSVEHSAVLALDCNNINSKDSFDGMLAYGKSKVAQVMFTLYLDEELKSLNSHVEVVAAHPGIVDTEIFDKTLVKRCFPFLPKLLFKTPEVGAKPIVYAALYGKGGQYIGNCAPQPSSTLSRRKEDQRKLFLWSKATLGIELFGNVC